MDGFEPSVGFVEYIEHRARPTCLTTAFTVMTWKEMLPKGAHLRLIPDNPHAFHNPSLFELSP